MSSYNTPQNFDCFLGSLFCKNTLDMFININKIKLIILINKLIN